MLSASKNFVKFCLILLFFVIFLFFATPVFAEKFTAQNAASFAEQANKGGINAEEITYTEVAARIAKAAFSIGGIIFFLLMFYGGYTWLMARGEEEQITKAQNIIIGAIIGLFIMVGSYAFTNFVLGRMISGTSSTPAATTPGEPTGLLGCCLNEVQAPSGFWDIGSMHHWNSEITDKATCDINIKTCTKEDELCESQNGAFYENITDADECWDLAEGKKTN